MNDKIDVSWMSNPQYLAQASHFLGGAGLIVTAAMFSLATHSGWEPTLWTLAFGVVAATAKEFGFDVAPVPYGEGDSWSDSFMDWTFYMLGGGVGMALAAWAYHLAGSC
jgi:hypothetical protein